MVDLLTAAVFVFASAVPAWFAWRIGRRARGLDRLVEPEAPPKRKLPDLKRTLRRVAGRLGEVLPFAGRRDPLIRRRLMRAGYRGADAERTFQVLRAALAVTAAALGMVVALQRSESAGRLLLWCAAACACGYLAPMQWLLFRIRGRKRAIEKGLPNALDLMVVCVESGLGIDQTVLQVSKEMQQAHPEISEEFTIMNLELRAGKRRAEALHNLAERTGVDDVRKLVSVLVQTDRFGTSIAQSLRGHADYLRIMSRQRAEEKASKIAVKLVFPIFFCILPSLFVVTVGPVITRLVRDLIPLIKNM